MDHLPPEIWEQISSFACIDSGQTGRSLSLVSRYIRDVSRSCQYQSVSLTRSKHILKFRQTLLHAPLKARRIKYLHVCCPDVFTDASDEEDSDYVETPTTISSPSGSDESMEIGSDSSAEEYEGLLTAAEELQEVLDDSMVLTGQPELSPLPQESNDNDDWYLHFWDDFDDEIDNADNVFIEAFRDILREASSSLLILSVNWTSFRSLVSIEELLIPLPNLVELHLYRESTSYRARSTDAAPTLFPGLQRLHICGELIYQHDSFGQDLGRIAPSLTHIRMPNHHISWRPPGSENYRIPDTIQKVIFEFPVRDSARDKILGLLFGTGVHSKEIINPFRSWTGDPNDWERSWMERVIGLDGPWR